MMLRRHGWLLVKAGISLTLLALLFSRINLQQVLDTLLTANPLLLLIAFGVTGISWAVNSAKWGHLLRVLQHQAPFSTLIILNYIGFYYGLVLPGQVSGEVMKGVRLTQAGVPASQTAVSIGMDRLTGLIGLGLLGIGGLLLAPRTAFTLPLLMLSAALTALCLVVLLLPQLLPVVAIAHTADGPGGRLRAVLHDLLTSAGAYRKAPGALIVAVAGGLAYQVLVTLVNYGAALALGIDVPLLTLTWIVATVSLLNLLPIAFAGLGLREGAYALLLAQQGVPLSQGLALSLTVFAIIVAQGIIGGVLEVVGPKPAPATNRAASK